MPTEKGQIGLQIAARRKPEKDSFDYRSASVEQWTQELPVGNIGETARLVYEALHQVNRLAISWKERYRFLELLREPVNYIQTSLVRRYTGFAFPLPEKTQRIANLAKTLSSEMALGYKSAIEEMLGSSFLRRDNKALTILIHRAIRYLSQAQLISYQTYAPHPKGSWSELHSLYLYAEHKRIYQNPVRDEYNTQMPESSIARAYKQILLLALASPYRLRQGEAEAIYLALARWAGHAHIIPYNAPDASEALFVVHMDSDEAPDYQAFNHRNCDTELCRLVDTRQLSHVLFEELKKKNSEKKYPLPISPDLLKRMIRTWGVAPKRHFTRNERESSLEVVVGASMLHRALSLQVGDPALRPKRSSYESRTITSINQPTKDDVWDIFGSRTMKNTYEKYAQMSEPGEEEAAPELTSQVWQIRNESAGGYRLALEKRHSAKVQVGELLGMREHGKNSPWEVGVVRWLRHDDEGSLEIGVQVMAPQARPVMVKNDKSGGKAAEYQYALLLPEIPAINQPASIITPIMLFQPGNELSLHLPGHDIRLQLDEKVQDSGSFVQFHYHTTEQQPPRKAAPAKKDSDGNDIDSVWDDL